MKSVILSCSEGNRLRPITCSIPKSMLPIMGRPIAEHTVRLLHRHGINNITIAADYLAEEIKKLSETTGQEIGKVNELTEKVLGSVSALSDASNHIIEFLDEVVLRDYDKLETLADSYKKDATYYAQVSNELRGNTKELCNAITSINQILDTINLSQKELDSAVQSVNGNLQEITYASENVSKETQEVMESVYILQETMQQFQV